MTLPLPRRKKKRFRILKLTLIVLKFIVLNLLKKVYISSKRGAYRTGILKDRRKVKKMPKVKIEQSIPPMPGGSEAPPMGDPENKAGLYSPSIGSENPDAVSEDLAGDLIALPFEAWHLFNEAADPLSESEKARLAGPFARIMEKYGLGKIAKDEIVFGFYLTAICYGRVKACQEAARKRKLESTIETKIVEH
jgi:hypothetical protein